jgi:hypothetical protein
MNDLTSKQATLVVILAIALSLLGNAIFNLL